jgi:hypothetical protein
LSHSAVSGGEDHFPCRSNCRIRSTNGFGSYTV